MELVPAPGEWHPWYQDKPWLMDWLNDRKSMYYRVPVMRPLRALFVENASLFDFEPRELLLTKRRAWTFAPWAERPYVYMWNIATDQYGRQISGDNCWIEYIEDYDKFLAYVSEWMI